MHFLHIPKLFFSPQYKYPDLVVSFTLAAASFLGVRSLVWKRMNASPRRWSISCWWDDKKNFIGPTGKKGKANVAVGGTNNEISWAEPYFF
jgi:hypothetical protein